MEKSLMLPDWLRDLAEQGTPRGVAGNNPLWLDAPDSVWLIRAGWIDVFAVPSLPDGVPGPRHHLFRVNVGGLLCGVFAQTADHPRLLAVGDQGSEVVHLRRDQLAALASLELDVLLTSWIGGLTESVVLRPVDGRGTPLEPGQLQLGPHQTATPSERFVWARHVAGASQFLGKIELTLREEDGFLPFSGGGWLTAGDEGARLEVVTTDKLPDEPGWPFHLDRFHRVMLSVTAAKLAEVHNRERERLEERAKSDERLMAATLSRLAGVARRETEEDQQADEDPLFAACRLVCGRLGVAVRAPQIVGEGRRRSDPMSAIARASRVRVRRVLLKGDWWREEIGPLVAYRAADEQPVALLPTSATRLEIVDPQMGTRERLTAPKAAALLPFAHSFYRPFAAKTLTIWKLFQFSLKGSGRDWITIGLTGLGGSLLGLAVPVVTGWIFDSIIPGAERSQLLLIVLGLTISMVAISLFLLTRGIAMVRLQTRMETGAQAGLWDRLLDLPATFFRRFSSGDLADRALGISTIRQILSNVALSGIFTLVFSLSSFALMFYYDVRMALLASGIFVVVAVITSLAALAQTRYQRRLFKVRGEIAGFVFQLVTGLARIRVAGAEARALAVWTRLFSLQRRLAFRTRTIQINLGAFNAATSTVSVIALYAVVSLRAQQTLSLGSFLAFVAAFGQVLAAAMVVSSMVSSLSAIMPLQERAKLILETPPEVDLDKALVGELKGDIEVAHVSFRYQPDGPAILDDVSVHIRPGEFVAFVGPSGAGKSTILRLLLGFEAPQSGSIYYDRLDLAGLDLQAVRQQMGVVLQDGKLMSGDILTNITGSVRLTEQDAWEAAALSGLDDDIRNMPMGMFTVIGEGGSTLSGGQRQRLMIARAIASKPQVLVFDEATSALDNETQAKVSASLRRIPATRVVVAHRLSTVVEADRIYVLEGGRIIQSGTYQELMQQGGLFAELAHRQLA